MKNVHKTERFQRNFITTNIDTMSCSCNITEIVAEFLPEIYKLMEKKSKENNWLGHILTIMAIVLPIVFAILTQGFKVCSKNKIHSETE